MGIFYLSNMTMFFNKKVFMLKNEKELLIDLMSIPSLSGKELTFCNYVYLLLQNLNFDNLKKIPIDENGFNILATKGTPQIMLQAHMDTVGPFIPPTEKEGKIYGRGSCDTKGSMTGMIKAVERALDEGISDFSLLFTVGEETDFRGIKKFVSQQSDFPFVVVGEPTSLKTINGQYGLLNLNINANGRRAHTSAPENGINAIDKLIGIIGKLETIKLGLESKRTLSIIKGGIQDNVVPDEAYALFNLRIAPADKADYLKLFQEVVAEYEGVRVSINDEIPYLPSILTAIPEKLSFLELGPISKGATELSFLKNGIILGPGDLKNAHSDNEFVEIPELEGASRLYYEILKSISS